MARWLKGQSGNPKGRPRSGTAIAQLARAQVDKHKLVEKLGSIGARQGEYAKVDVDQQVRAIQLLLAYGYGPPRPDTEGGDGSAVLIEVTYVERNQIAITGAAPGAITSHSGSETVQRGLLRAPLGQDVAGYESPDSSGSAG